MFARSMVTLSYPRHRMRGFPFFNRRDAFTCLIGVTLVGVVAAIDLWLSNRVNISLAHAAIVLTGLATRNANVTLVLAGLGTLATVTVGVFGSNMQGFSDLASVANRGMTLAMIWIVASLLIYARRSSPEGFTAQKSYASDKIKQAVFDQTFQFIAVLDADGNILETNETLRDYTGLTANEARAKSVWLLPLFHNDTSAQKRLQSAVAAAAAGHFTCAEFDVAGSGNEPAVIDLSLKPMRVEGGSIRHIIMEARDVTEARIQQEMLAQAQRMETFGQLTAGVAHDFNNLLMVIVGNLELLDRRLNGDEKVRNRLERAIKAAFRGQTLTQQLLAFSRRQPLNPVVLDINACLLGMSQIYEGLDQNVKTEFDLGDDLPPSEVDPTLLEMAIRNIAINARDAMPNGGVIRFQTALTEIDKTYHGDVRNLPVGKYICLSISDSGDGIRGDILPQVFDPFFTTKSNDESTGLGLSMVYGFVKQSRGDVKIYSKEGQGTTVRLYLPATDKPLPETAKAKYGYADDIQLEGKLVLVVDDDDDIREVVSNALSELGCQVETVPSGDAAIDLIKSGNHFDLIFTDVVMPRTADGLAVAHAARAASPGVPVIYCSGFPYKTLVRDERSFDGALFLAKPFHRDALIETVKRAFELQRRKAKIGDDDEMP